MSKQEDTSSSQVQPPTTNDKEDWKNYRGKKGQAWRNEPEIKPERQKELKACLEKCARIKADIKEEGMIKEGKYPFKGMKLKRADVVWLLETHENGRGPVDWSDKKQQGREGLDLRGANLQGVDLRGLQISRMLGGLTPDDWQDLSPEQRDMAAVNLENAQLEEAHLEGAKLGRANLSGANLFSAHLQQAILHSAHLEGVNLYGAHLEGTDLRRAYFDITTVLEGAALRPYPKTSTLAKMS